MHCVVLFSAVLYETPRRNYYSNEKQHITSSLLTRVDLIRFERYATKESISFHSIIQNNQSIVLIDQLNSTNITNTTQLNSINHSLTLYDRNVRVHIRLNRNTRLVPMHGVAQDITPLDNVRRRNLLVRDQYSSLLNHRFVVRFWVGSKLGRVNIEDGSSLPPSFRIGRIGIRVRL